MGVGVSYNWFSDIQLNPNFVTSTQNNLGSVLAAGAGKPGTTQVVAEGVVLLATGVQRGRGIQHHGSLGAGGVVTYIPLKTTSSVIVKAADGTELAVSKAELKADPIISFLAVSYKF